MSVEKLTCSGFTIVMLGVTACLADGVGSDTQTISSDESAGDGDGDSGDGDGDNGGDGDGDGDNGDGDGDSGGDGDGDNGDGDGDGDGGTCGSEWAEKDGMTPSIMEIWGAPCTSDADCVPTLGANGVCLTNILGAYQFPGGYCTKYCDLPDTSTTFVHDAPGCDPDGGVTCTGAKDFFSVCMLPCTDSSECGREGYGCRGIPTLASADDPTFCLMDPSDCCLAGEEGCR
jgi:hypothetical protein